MTKDEFRQKLIAKYPGLDSRNPITFASGEQVLQLLLQAYDFGKRSSDRMDAFRGMFGMK